TPDQFRRVDGLEAAHRLRLAVRLLGRLILEDEQVHEPRRVVGLLPRRVEPGAGLVGGHVRDELLDRGLDLVNGLRGDLVVRGLVDRHGVLPDRTRTVQKLNNLVERLTYDTPMDDEAALDRTYAALADPTRRALLVALRGGEARITDLARPFAMTFAGVS